MPLTMQGLGNNKASFRVYIENIPPLERYQNLQITRPMEQGEIKMIADETGNHWRKIFNVYAKLLFDINPRTFSTWQQLRDNYLLQNSGHEALLFSPPEFNEAPSPILHIIMGKSYANKLGLADSAFWLNDCFAINKQKRIIICPYFDYRQLSNARITQLVGLIHSLTGSHPIALRHTDDVSGGKAFI